MRAFYYSYLRFTHEATGPERLSIMPKFMQHVRGQSGDLNLHLTWF